jgi:moderate conductance mechanosensitive channel
VVQRLIRSVTEHIADGSSFLVRPLGSEVAGALRKVTPVAAARRTQRARTIGSVLRSASSAIILGIAAVMILAEFDVSLGPILASAGIVGVAIGFGAQSLVRDFLSGMFMLLEDQYGVGDVVDLGSANATGVVEAVGLRITTVRDGTGTVWYVRNGEILRVGNKSQGYAVAVADLPLAHGADIGRATEIATRVVAEVAVEPEVAEHLVDPPDVVGIEKVGPEGVTFRVTARTGPGARDAVQRALITALAEAFDAEGLPRPLAFPSARPPTTGP